MPNINPRGGIFKSSAIARLHVPKVVSDPQTPADKIHYGDDAVDGWEAVLIAINPAYMTAERRKQILKDFGRLLTVLKWEEAVFKRAARDATVARKWHAMKASGRKLSAHLIANVLKMNHDEVRKIVRRLHLARPRKTP